MKKKATTKILIGLPVELKAYLEARKQEGYTASGYVRRLILADQAARGRRPARTRARAHIKKLDTT